MWCEPYTAKDGTISYKYSERYTCPYSGKLKKVSVTYSKNSRQAEKAAYTELQEKIQKILNADIYAERTLDSLLTEFINSRKPFVKPTTNHGHLQKQRAINNLLPKDILISKLTTALLQTNLCKFLEDNSYSYTRSLFCLIHQSFKYAKRLGYIKEISFIENVELPKPQKTVEEVKKERAKFLTKDELADILERIRNINVYVSLICEFQSLTGLRIGELLALRRQDFDRKNKTIDVNGTLTSRYTIKDGEIRLSPKNSYSIRTVSLSLRAIQILHRFIMANNTRKVLDEKYNPDNYIFTTDGGRPYDVHFINKIIKRANFYKPVSTHTFRHTHISLLAEANVPLKAIMERVGHNEPRTTLSVYTHVTESMKQQLDNAINNISLVIANK